MVEGHNHLNAVQAEASLEGFRQGHVIGVGTALEDPGHQHVASHSAHSLSSRAVLLMTP